VSRARLLAIKPEMDAAARAPNDPVLAREMRRILYAPTTHCFYPPPRRVGERRVYHSR
jgi:hypothetical protein